MLIDAQCAKRRPARIGHLVAAALLAVLPVGVGGCMSAAELTAYLDKVVVTDPDFAALPAGTYQGAFTLDLPAGAWAANRTVAVTLDVSEQRLQAIAITRPEGFATDEGFARLIARVIAAQSLKVDAVSGASISSKAFFKAVEDAAAKPPGG